jgi:hypothetical protein
MSDESRDQPYFAGKVACFRGSVFRVGAGGLRGRRRLDVAVQESKRVEYAVGVAVLL